MQRFVITTRQDEISDVKFDLLSTEVTFEGKQLYNIVKSHILNDILNNGNNYTIKEVVEYDNFNNEYNTCNIDITD